MADRKMVTVSTVAGEARAPGSKAEQALITAVAEIVRDYFGYADSDFAIPCDEVVANRLGLEVLQRAQQSGLKLCLRGPCPLHREQ